MARQREGFPDPNIERVARAVAGTHAAQLTAAVREAARGIADGGELGPQAVIEAALMYEVVERLHDELYPVGREMIDAAVATPIDGKAVALRAQRAIAELAGVSRSGVQWAFGRERSRK
ncbi:hypothetical protein [Microbacterium laevaniformans]|uniref:hypothetical protein n=1 Tax=Microbacterium laevaniformans TaxID=36807 RepID=UPI003D97462A